LQAVLVSTKERAIVGVSCGLFLLVQQRERLLASVAGCSC